MKDIEQAVHELDRLGVIFTVTHEGPGGIERLVVTGPQLVAYARDPQSWLASHYGVSRHDYLDWHVDRYTAFCSCKTSSDRPCRNTVPGGKGVSPRRWAELQGSKCAAHAAQERAE
jgi:hypothetical protein